MWSLYLNAKDYQRSPSQMVGIEHPYLAWCIDDAIGTWGRDIQNKLEMRDKKGKSVHNIYDLLGVDRPTKKMTRAEFARM